MNAAPLPDHWNAQIIYLLTGFLTGTSVGAIGMLRCQPVVFHERTNHEQEPGSGEANLPTTASIAAGTRLSLGSDASSDAGPGRRAGQ